MPSVMVLLPDADCPDQCCQPLLPVFFHVSFEPSVVLQFFTSIESISQSTKMLPPDAGADVLHPNTHLLAIDASGVTVTVGFAGNPIANDLEDHPDHFLFFLPLYCLI